MQQEWSSGKSTRLQPMWPGFDSQTRSHLWVEFVVGFRPYTDVFFSKSPFFPLLGNQIINLESRDTGFVSLRSLNTKKGVLLYFKIEQQVGNLRCRHVETNL